MIAINIQRYGDDDIPYTVAIMIAPPLYSKKIARGLVRRISDEHSTDDDIDAVIKELKQLGFETASELSLKVGGGL